MGGWISRVVRSPHSANIAFYRLYRRFPYIRIHTRLRTRSLEGAIRYVVRTPCAGEFHVN